MKRVAKATAKALGRAMAPKITKRPFLRGATMPANYKTAQQPTQTSRFIISKDMLTKPSYRNSGNYSDWVFNEKKLNQRLKNPMIQQPAM
jgi:hypothetical protein